MTENLLQHVEEKVMHLVMELENLRKEIGQLRQENAAMKMEKNNYAQKMQGLISLLDTIDSTGELVQSDSGISQEKYEIA